MKTFGSTGIETKEKMRVNAWTWVQRSVKHLLRERNSATFNGSYDWEAVSVTPLRILAIFISSLILSPSFASQTPKSCAFFLSPGSGHVDQNALKNPYGLKFSREESRELEQIGLHIEAVRKLMNQRRDFGDFLNLKNSYIHSQTGAILVEARILRDQFTEAANDVSQFGMEMSPKEALASDQLEKFKSASSLEKEELSQIQMDEFSGRMTGRASRIDGPELPQLWEGALGLWGEDLKKERRKRERSFKKYYPRLKASIDQLERSVQALLDNETWNFEFLIKAQLILARLADWQDYLTDPSVEKLQFASQIGSVIEQEDVLDQIEIKKQLGAKDNDRNIVSIKEILEIFESFYEEGYILLPLNGEPNVKLELSLQFLPIRFMRFSATEMDDRVFSQGVVPGYRAYYGDQLLSQSPEKKLPLGYQNSLKDSSINSLNQAFDMKRVLLIAARSYKRPSTAFALLHFMFSREALWESEELTINPETGLLIWKDSFAMVNYLVDFFIDWDKLNGKSRWDTNLLKDLQQLEEFYIEQLGGGTSFRDLVQVIDHFISSLLLATEKKPGLASINETLRRAIKEHPDRVFTAYLNFLNHGQDDW